MTREDELIKRMEYGDTLAANELIEMYYPEILRYCIWNAPNRHLAEDAAQETFLKAICYFDHYVHKGKFKAFLYQIALNTCVDMKRRKWTTYISLEQLSEEVAYHENGFEEVDVKLQLRQMTDSLPEELQEIVILRYAQELSMREIAQIVNLPMRTVQSRLRSALKKLKKELSGERFERRHIRNHEKEAK